MNVSVTKYATGLYKKWTITEVSISTTKDVLPEGFDVNHGACVPMGIQLVGCSVDVVVPDVMHIVYCT